VLTRLTTGHNFLKKSYWLNTGGDTALAEADTLVSSFDRSASGFKDSVHFLCADSLLFHGNQLVHSWAQPYKILASDPPPQMPSTIAECSGLFQLAWVTGSMLRSMSSRTSGEYPGWPVEARYTVDKNFFNVDLNRLMNGADGGPRVHATIAVAGFGAV